LRKEPRLEHAAPVLVRDSALAPVADGLDNRDADMARGLLDRVDHCLDPLADHDCLDLDHHTSLFSPTKKAPQEPKLLRRRCLRAAPAAARPRPESTWGAGRCK